MKLIAAARGFVPEANLILAMPYLLFAVWGGIMMKKEDYHWAYVIAGVVVISLVRYFERDWMQALNHYFN